LTQARNPASRKQQARRQGSMADKSWKDAERQVAKKLHAQRNPLSGRMGGHTSGDTIHDSLYVEVKQKKRFAVLLIMKDTEKKALKERKIPVLVIHQSKAKRRYYIIQEELFLQLWSYLPQSKPPASPSP